MAQGAIALGLESRIIIDSNPIATIVVNQVISSELEYELNVKSEVGI